MKESTIKELYIKLQELYSNVLNVLTAINQSFATTSSEITVNIMDSDDIQQTLRIPSFLYLESKIEQIDSNLNNLFNMPKSGEAWFSKSSDMYKLELVKSNNAPVSPKLSDDKLYAYSKDTYIFKDLVNPKTYLKLGIDNLPDNIQKMFVKKMVFYNADTYSKILSSGYTKYDEIKALLYNLNEGIDYEEYDSVIDLPIKHDEYVSDFKILDIPQGEQENPYFNTESENNNNLIYKVILDTLIYSPEEDTSIEYTLQPGQYLCLDNEYVIYKVLSINSIINNKNIKQHEVTLEEVSGHIALQKYEENSSMVLHIYNKDYSKYHYVELPLEENPFIAFFVSTIYNNTRSVLSDALLLNLNNIMMVNSDGTPMLVNGKEISYIDYYNHFCSNVGDMLLGISNIAYSQMSNYSNEQINELLNSDAVQSRVSMTINDELFKVQRINTHLINDEYSTKIINLHTKRNELTSDINSLQANIDTIYNQLVTTDFASDVTQTQLSLKNQLDNLYSQRILLQKELISIVDNINSLKIYVSGLTDSKYRVRGTTATSELESFIDEFYPKCKIIKMEVEYKYKSTNLDTTQVQNINSNIFTDWNKLDTIVRERKPKFNNINNSYTIEFENYDNIDNIIKWNQIDIPITSGEDVVIRVRYLYSIGQPFINLYSPWSNEITVAFPIELSDSSEISSIIAQNKEDEIDARFNKTLLNDGYQEHISNKIIDNSQVYFHMPENIYSGFNTPENKFINLKDKLQELTNEINSYKDLILGDATSSYSLYLVFDNKQIELFSESTNDITINENALISSDSIITKNMKLVLKNTGSEPLKLYSLFPGNKSKCLIQLDDQYARTYESMNYERVPILLETDGPENLRVNDTVRWQTLGQWIYFRQNTVFNTTSYYVDNKYDYIDTLIQNVNEENTSFNIENKYKLEDYINTPQQPLLPNRLRYWDILGGYNLNGIIYNNSYTYNDGNYNILPTQNLTNTNELNKYYSKIDNANNDFKYTDKEDNTFDNNFVLRYEHIWGKNSLNKNIQIQDNYSINELLENNKFEIKTNNETNRLTSKDIIGGFLIPTLTSENQIMCNENNNSCITLAVSDSLTIPITFQYYLGNGNNSDDENKVNNKVEKYLSFDIKKSLLQNPKNYVIHLIANYNVNSDINISTVSSN